MSELHDLLERRAADHDPPADLLARVRERSQQRQRNRRMGSTLAGIVVVAVTIAGLTRVLPPSDTVLFDPTLNPVEGTWVSIDGDGSSQTMQIRAVDGVGYQVTANDDGASVCAGAPSTMTGTGQLDDTGLVIPKPVLTCDDGSEAVALDGSSLPELLRDYTLVYGADADTLTDNMGVTWRRPGATPPPGAPAANPPVGWWPQTSLDQVREAQERADAGDPAYAWQVDPQLDAGQVVGTREIFTRFLTEALGWEQYMWGMGYSESASDDQGRMVEVPFTRCAKGETNPVYPNDPKARGCAPTVDDLTYETVNLVAYQPLGTGPNDIWIVQRSYRGEPLRQTVPPTDTEIADFLDAFGQARLDGQGAERHLQTPSWDQASEVPLLYATRNGAPYDRFDHEVLQGPMWPSGSSNVNLRLFADGGKTVVEQRFELQSTAGELALTYYPSSDDDAATTENGAAVPEPYALTLGGDADRPALTFSRPPSWRGSCCVYGEDLVWDWEPNLDLNFVVIGDPLVSAGGCDEVGEQPASSDGLVRSLQASPDLSVTAPKAVRLGGIDAVQLDVTSAKPAGCVDNAPVLAPRPHDGGPDWVAIGAEREVRVLVFDVEGNPRHTVAVVMDAPKRVFERALRAAAPVLETFQLRTD